MGLSTLVLGIFCSYVLVKAIILSQAKLKLRKLETQQIDAKVLKELTLVVPVRNEANTLRAALTSILKQKYPGLHIIAVNDRSTDSSLEQLQDLESKYNNLKIINIRELPSGWLGKTYALDVGARAASSENILFSDADIHFSESCLEKALSYFENEKLDHLSLLIRCWSRSLWVDAFIPFFAQNFLLYFRPWEASDPSKPHRFVGIGAFNLVRKSVLEKIGYFSQIALRPDDDVKLGKLIKQNGFRQDCLAAPDYASVEWYYSLKDCVRGLEKNIFAGTDYRISIVLAGILATLLPTLAPLYIFMRGSIGEILLILLFVMLDILLAIISAKEIRTPLSRALLMPVATMIYVYILVRNPLKNLWQGGVYWRDTFYPLKELKKNVV